ncbi:putative acyl-CoA synthetase short-chain family member 3, mitochondrial [Apostichopus japonicus]|uniref:Acyl-CoA synthetase short-chain family member 3, mitochondrial n=1 Tax=Stichopus japonicus TaxID=307972 RepID=A0A2G8JIE1_STIJA|nr:putative acyl-CoA synthetase short-chain family member 3, mitochondrial [Apostichopus japonicus]
MFPQPKVIVSANVGIEPSRTVNYKGLLDAAIEMSDHKPKTCIIHNRTGYPEADMVKGRDLQWSSAVSDASLMTACQSEPWIHFYLIHFRNHKVTEVRPSAGYAVVLYWTMKNIYGMEPGEVWWAASDLGWVVGHSYICYAPLLHRNTTVLYEGKPVGTPDPGAFFRVIQDHNVTSMFTAPTALRAIRKEDFDGNHSKSYSFPNFKNLFVAGEICDHETLHWCRETFKVPVIDHWWQTETGWAITATCLGLGDEATARDQSIGKPVPGWDVHVLDSDNGQEVSRGQLGKLQSTFIARRLGLLTRLPLPPGSFSSLWQQGDRFVTTYFQKFPVDDVINVAGHRISASAVEEAMVNQGDIVECATIGLKDSLKGHVPVGLCVLRSGTVSDQWLLSRVLWSCQNYQGPDQGKYRDRLWLRWQTERNLRYLLRSKIRQLTANFFSHLGEWGDFSHDSLQHWGYTALHTFSTSTSQHRHLLDIFIHLLDIDIQLLDIDSKQHLHNKLDMCYL